MLRLIVAVALALILVGVRPADVCLLTGLACLLARRARDRGER